MGQPNQTLIQVNPPQPANSLPPSNQSQILMQSPEAFKVYEKITDSELLYMRDFVRLLYGRDLYKQSGGSQLDPDSPVAGYATYGGSEDEMAMTIAGCRKVMSMTMLFYNQALSTTETDPKRFDLELFSLNATMSITDMIIANRKRWKFKDPMLIKPLGMAIWRNMVAIGLRSHNGGKFAKMLLNIPGLALGGPNPEPKTSRWSL